MGRATSRRQSGSGQGLPGWAMLAIGLIIGLFVAFLVYLDDLDQPPSAAVESGGDDRSATDAGEEGDGKPRFEFYSILPDLEVIVPDAPTDDGAAGEDADDAAAGTGLDPEGTYFLQVGSFQERGQAERMKAEVALLGLDVDIQDVDVSGQRWHRVRIGPYADQAKLSAAQRRLRDNDIEYLVLRQKSSG